MKKFVAKVKMISTEIQYVIEELEDNNYESEALAERLAYFKARLAALHNYEIYVVPADAWEDEDFEKKANWLMFSKEFLGEAATALKPINEESNVFDILDALNVAHRKVLNSLENW